MRIHICMYVYVCVYIYIYVYVYVCMYVFICLLIYKQGLLRVRLSSRQTGRGAGTDVSDLDEELQVGSYVFLCVFRIAKHTSVDSVCEGGCQAWHGICSWLF
jgi:hypothetical protein